MTELSPLVACTLTDADLAAQAGRWKRLRAEAGIDRVTTDDGLRTTFRDDPAVEQELTELVAVENECCAWASWEIAREDGVLVMQARSTGDGIAALHGMLAHSRGAL
jgi:hypothetical protein